jgi:hypothetical protein
LLAGEVLGGAEQQALAIRAVDAAALVLRLIRA